MFCGLRFWLLATLALLASLVAAPAQVTTAPTSLAPRFALVIGNATYTAGPLPTAANDAGLIAETLALAGFDVTAAADTNIATLQKLVQDFTAKVTAAANPDATIVVYLTGYGLQVDGDNYLVPVDAKIPRDVDVSGMGLRLSDLAHGLDAAPAKARIYVYDLARETPFARTGAPLASGLGIAPAGPNSLVAFNTAPGTIGPADGAVYGTYPRLLAAMLGVPGLPARALFDRLRLQVTEVSNGTLVPWDDSQLDPNAAVVPTAAGGVAEVGPGAPSQPLGSLPPDAAFFAVVGRDRLDDYATYLSAFKGEPLTSRVRTMTAARREALIWAASVKADTPPAYWTYMRRYPRGPHLFDARRRLALLHAQLEPPPRFDLYDFGGLGKPSPDELTVLARRPLSLEDADDPPLPAPPDGLIPPPPADASDLTIPPLAVPGALPIPMPLKVPSGRQYGLVRQPFVLGGSGEMLTQLRVGDNGSPEIVTTQAGKIVSLARVENEPGRHIVTQRDAKGAIISRSVSSVVGDQTTTIQTGPTGGILKKIVSKADPSGARTTAVSNGNNQVITTIDRDRNGVLIDSSRGPAPPRDETIVVKHPPEAKGTPKVEPAVEALRKAPPEPPPSKPSEPANPTPAVRPNPPVPAVGPTSNPQPPKTLKVEPAPPPAAPPNQAAPATTSPLVFPAVPPDALKPPARVPVGPALPPKMPAPAPAGPPAAVSPLVKPTLPPDALEPPPRSPVDSASPPKPPPTAVQPSLPPLAPTSSAAPLPPPRPATLSRAKTSSHAKSPAARHPPPKRGRAPVPKRRR